MWIFFLILLCGIAQADVYVLTDSSNNVLGLSEQKDMVKPSGDTITHMSNVTIAALPITGDPTMYTFSGNAFTLNTAKLSAQQASQAAAVAAQTAENNAKASALSKLTDAISKVDVNDVLTNQELSALLPS